MSGLFGIDPSVPPDGTGCFEPGESWFWNYRNEGMYTGPALAAPEHRPREQPVPGPAGRVPADWERLLN
jgi:hypothetical protein